MGRKAELVGWKYFEIHGSLPGLVELRRIVACDRSEGPSVLMSGISCTNRTESTISETLGEVVIDVLARNFKASLSFIQI